MAVLLVHRGITKPSSELANSINSESVIFISTPLSKLNMAVS